MKKWLKRIKKDERGLTLVELLAVVVILAIVAAIAFISIGNVIENSKKDAHISNAMQIVSAAKLHEASGGEIDSTGIDTSELDTLSDLVNPWNNDESYEGKVLKNGSRAGEEESDGEGVYRVILEEEKCKINHTEKELRTLDRKDICSDD